MTVFIIGICWGIYAVFCGWSFYKIMDRPMDVPRYLYPVLAILTPVLLPLCMAIIFIEAWIQHSRHRRFKVKK